MVVAANPSPVSAARFEAPPALSPVRNLATAWWFGGGLVFLLGLILFLQLGIRRKLARLQTQGALVPIGSGSYNVVVAPGQADWAGPSPVVPPPAPLQEQEALLRRGLLPHLAEWLKQAFVQRLVTDRQKLLTTQETATMKVLAVDERLARLEAKIQEETSSYEKQIDHLNRELLTAREENLDLIRAQIKLLKSEMDEARARVLGSEAV
jgi:uncharacterized coiled-coil protein SlyX